MSSAERAKSIFLNASEMAAVEQRHAYLDQACGGDEALRGEVEELLSHHAGLGSFLEGAPSGAQARATEGPGTVIGPYRLQEEIGEGGFGVAYVAEQSEPKDDANKWYRRAVAWADKQENKDEEPERFRKEAAQLLEARKNTSK